MFLLISFKADYEFISSGLYLVVLLHLCEQRFSDMLGSASEASTRVRVSMRWFYGRNSLYRELGT